MLVEWIYVYFGLNKQQNVSFVLLVSPVLFCLIWGKSKRNRWIWDAGACSLCLKTFRFFALTAVVFNTMEHVKPHVNFYGKMTCYVKTATVGGLLHRGDSGGVLLRWSKMWHFSCYCGALRLSRRRCQSFLQITTLQEAWDMWKSAVFSRFHPCCWASDNCALVWCRHERWQEDTNLQGHRISDTWASPFTVWTASHSIRFYLNKSNSYFSAQNKTVRNTYCCVKYLSIFWFFFVIYSSVALTWSVATL